MLVEALAVSVEVLSVSVSDALSVLVDALAVLVALASVSVDAASVLVAESEVSVSVAVLFEPCETAMQLPKPLALVNDTRHLLPVDPPVHVIPAGSWTVSCSLPSCLGACGEEVSGNVMSGI